MCVGGGDVFICVWDVYVCQTDSHYTWKEELNLFTVHYLEADGMSTSLIPLPHVGGADRSLPLDYRHL